MAACCELLLLFLLGLVLHLLLMQDAPGDVARSLDGDARVEENRIEDPVLLLIKVRQMALLQQHPDARLRELLYQMSFVDECDGRPSDGVQP